MGKEDMICNEQQYMSPPAKKRAAIGNMQGTDIAEIVGTGGKRWELPK